MVSNDRNVLQSAYQIRASLTKEGLKSEKTLFWNSQKINSDQSVQVDYTGPELESGQRIFWQVKVWDNHGKTSEWSNVAFFEMGLLNPSDWKAQWIEPDLKENVMSSNPCPFLRKEFNVQKPVKSARLYATAHGLYLLNLNGNRVNDELFNPGWTSYNKRLQFQVFDITDQLLPGQNVIGLLK
jgi:alpha-L-rhamnosidase